MYPGVSIFLLRLSCFHGVFWRKSVPLRPLPLSYAFPPSRVVRPFAHENTDRFPTIEWTHRPCEKATTTLQGYVAEHPNASLRAFSISRLASACTRCWSFLDRRAFLNGGCEEGGDAQRYKQVGGTLAPVGIYVRSIACLLSFHWMRLTPLAHGLSELCVLRRFVFTHGTWTGVSSPPSVDP